jgi:hypothetical protein
MKRRHFVGVANALLVIGLAESLIGLLMAVISTPGDPAVSSHAGDRAAPPAGVPEIRVASPTPRTRGQTAWDDRAGHGDARLFLRDAAAAAQRRPQAESRRGETRTDLWINNPSSIGSMSRPDDHPGTPFSLN